MVIRFISINSFSRSALWKRQSRARVQEKNLPMSGGRWGLLPPVKVQPTVVWWQQLCGKNNSISDLFRTSPETLASLLSSPPISIDSLLHLSGICTHASLLCGPLIIGCSICHLHSCGTCMPRAVRLPPQTFLFLLLNIDHCLIPRRESRQWSAPPLVLSQRLMVNRQWSIVNGFNSLNSWN